MGVARGALDIGGVSRLVACVLSRGQLFTLASVCSRPSISLSTVMQTSFVSLSECGDWSRTSSISGSDSSRFVGDFGLDFAFFELNCNKSNRILNKQLVYRQTSTYTRMLVHRQNID